MALLPSAPFRKTSGLERCKARVTGILAGSETVLPSQKQSSELLFNFLLKMDNAKLVQR